MMSVQRNRGRRPALLRVALRLLSSGIVWFWLLIVVVVAIQFSASPAHAHEEDRNASSVTVDMPLPGESIEWLMSSGAAAYGESVMDFAVVELSGTYGELERWVSIDIVDSSMGSDMLVASGLSIGRFNAWSFACSHAGRDTCTLKARLHVDAQADNAVRNQDMYIRWMFSVQDNTVAEVDDEGNHTLAVSGASIPLGPVVLAVMTLSGLVLTTWRRSRERWKKGEQA
jgi:hypothetical protein